MRAKTKRDAVIKMPVSEYERENSFVTNGRRIEREFEMKLCVNHMIEQRTNAKYL